MLIRGCRLAPPGKSPVPLDPIMEEAMSDEPKREEAKVEDKPQAVPDEALEDAAGGKIMERYDQSAKNVIQSLRG
jgi:hypothetical protein